MSEIGSAPCRTCSDIRTLHPGGGKCVNPGCTCEGFLPVIPEVVEAETNLPWRRVCVDLPSGYQVQIMLIPIEGS